MHERIVGQVTGKPDGGDRDGEIRAGIDGFDEEGSILSGGDAPDSAKPVAPEQWAMFLEAPTLSAAEIAVRSHTYTGRPIGSEAFVLSAEERLGRPLVARAGGRPARKGQSVAVGSSQAKLFEAS